MEAPGHLGVALLVAAPVWFVTEESTSLAFLGLVLSTAMLPDIDLKLATSFPVAHHGITHSLLFVVSVALVLGALTTAAVVLVCDAADADFPDTGRMFGFAAAGYGTGAFAHLLGDFLTTPDVAPPLRPFQPFIETVMILDVAYVYSPVWNLGVLVLGILVNIALWARTTGPVHGRSFLARLTGR